MPTHTYPCPPIPTRIVPTLPTVPYKKAGIRCTYPCWDTKFAFYSAWKPDKIYTQFTPTQLSKHNVFVHTQLVQIQLVLWSQYVHINNANTELVHTRLLHTYLLLTQLVHIRGKAWQLVAAIALVCGLERTPGDIQRQVWVFWTWTGWFELGLADILCDRHGVLGDITPMWRGRPGT